MCSDCVRVMAGGGKVCSDCVRVTAGGGKLPGEKPVTLLHCTSLPFVPVVESVCLNSLLLLHFLCLYLCSVLL